MPVFYFGYFVMLTCSSYNEKFNIAKWISKYKVKCHKVEIKGKANN